MFSKYFTILLTFSATAIIRNEISANTQEYESFHTHLRIFNGNPATVGQIPYFVSIKEPVRRFTKDRILWKNLCGGSIISETKVVTAAHCFEVYGFKYLKHPQTLRVVAGSIRNTIIYSGINVTEDDNQWRPINRISMHEDFLFPNFDIALIYVSNWMYSDYVNYVVPASVTMDYSMRCQAAGFGMISQGMSDTPSPVLLVTTFYLIPRWKCSLLWNHGMDDFVCSEPTESDVTRGDSGGPLVCTGTSDPVEESGRDLLVGIVSGKSYGKSTLFTRLSAYNDWLGRNVTTKTPVNTHICLIMSMLIYIVYGI